MLIRAAEVGSARVDVRLAGGRIDAIAPALMPASGEHVVEARGGALLPGLHDHHIHLDAFAAALGSVRCGPPQVTDAAALATALVAAPGVGWLRGVGYHDSIAGAVDRSWLDAHGPARPIRIQHRSGRMWILNRLALAIVGLDPTADGRLVDSDVLLGERLRGDPPDLAPVGRWLASYGITGLTEVTPRNGLADYRRYAAAGLPQRLLVMGRAALDDVPVIGKARRGAVKLHYHDHDLPDPDALTAEVARAHAAGRPVASHCVTRGELMVTLAAIEEAGVAAGDRIEHGGIIDDAYAAWIARLGLTVVSQPHFLAERGAAYRAEVEPGDLPFLYRLAGLRRAGIRLGAGSDAPFGGPDPWAAMAAAVARPAGFGTDEALTPEEALALYTGAADDPGGPAQAVAVGSPADLCLLDRSWAVARAALGAVRVRSTIVGGEVVFRG